MLKWMDFLYYEIIISITVIRENRTFRKTHMKKLLGLLAECKSANGLLDPDSVITNLSSYKLSDVDKMALSRGLQFTLPLGSDRNIGSVRQKFYRTFVEFFSVQFHAHLQYTGIERTDYTILCKK